MPAAVTACLAPGSAAAESVAALGKTSSCQLLWRAGCGVHTHRLLRSVNAVCKQHDAYVLRHGSPAGFTLPCPACGIGTAPMSELCQRALTLVSTLWPNVPLAFDVCLPGSGVKSSADIMVPASAGVGGGGVAAGVMVMVDGAGHFSGIHAQSSAEGRWVDRRFDLAAYDRGYNVVRLHESNPPHVWCVTLMRARRLAGWRFLLYSPFYSGSLGLRDVVHAPGKPSSEHAEYAALIEQAAADMGERNIRPGHNRKRRGYCNDSLCTGAAPWCSRPSCPSRRRSPQRPPAR